MKKTNCLALYLLSRFMGLRFFSVAQRHGEDFYKGKTIHFIVGAPAGGGYDTYTRAIARHLGKHILGIPSMVVDNMDELPTDCG